MVLYPFLYLLLKLGLELVDMTLRSWMWLVLCIDIMFLLILAGIEIIISISRHSSRSRRTAAGRAAGGSFGIVLIVVIEVLVIVYGMFLTASSYKPEHVMELRGETLVAEVTSFLDVEVRYYDYKGIFFRGTKVRGYEWYGSGGYDPFKRNTKPEPKTYIYYDKDGKIEERYGE